MRHYITLFLLCCISSTTYAQTLIDSVIAVVNTEAITHSELEDAFRIAAIRGEPVAKAPTTTEKRAVLETIINRKFVLQESERIGVVIAEREAQIEEKIAEIRAEYATKADFENILQQSQLEIEALKTWVYEQLIYEEFFRRKFFNTVDSEKVARLAKAYYEANKTGKEYAEVREEIAERIQQAEAEKQFKAWLTKQKAEGTWHILDEELAQIRNEEP